MGKRELIALLNLSSWCLVMVERLFLAMPRGCLQFVIVVFPDHTHLLFLIVDADDFLLASDTNCTEFRHALFPRERNLCIHESNDNKRSYGIRKS